MLVPMPRAVTLTYGASLGRLLSVFLDDEPGSETLHCAITSRNALGGSAEPAVSSLQP